MNTFNRPPKESWGGKCKSLRIGSFCLLSWDSLDSYTGYDAAVAPTIANEFSTAAYRFRHSLFSPSLLFINNDGSPAINILLKDISFRPDVLVNDL